MTLVLLMALAGTGSLERLADELAAQTLEAKLEPPIGVSVSGPEVVARALSSLLIARLGARAMAPVPVEADTPASAERFAREHDLGSVLRLSVQVSAAGATVQGDGISTWVNFWSGKTPTRLGPAVVFARAAPLDEPLQLLVTGATPPRTVGALEVVELASLPRVPAAVAMGDLTHDGRPEILALVDDSLWVWSSERTLLAKHALEGAVALRPTRQPFALLEVVDGKALVWSSRRERAQSVTLRGTTAVSEPLQGLPALDGALLTPLAGTSAFAPLVQLGPSTLEWPEPLSRLSKRGSLLLGIGVSGRAAISRGSPPTAFVTRTGAATALVDLDGDATPEVLASTDRTVGSVDQLVLVEVSTFERMAARGASLDELSSLWSAPMTGRVMQLAHGDLEGDGVEEVVLGVWNPDGTGALRLVRRRP